MLLEVLRMQVEHNIFAGRQPLYTTQILLDFDVILYEYYKLKWCESFSKVDAIYGQGGTNYTHMESLRLNCMLNIMYLVYGSSLNVALWLKFTSTLS